MVTRTNAAMKTFYIHPAGFFSRFVAFIVDLVIISLGIFLFIAVINLITSFFNLSAFFAQVFGEDSSLVNTLEQVVILTTAFSGLLFSFAYFMFFWVMVGFTPGKALLGLRIVRENTEPITWRRAFLRMVGYWVSAIPFFLGYVWILFDEHRQGWHDKLADTYVVYVRDITEDK